MQLQPDLLRNLLLWAESNLPRPDGDLDFPELSGSTKDEIAYTCLMAHEAGLIQAIDVQGCEEPFEQMIPTRLTYSGHQYLERIRDPMIWQKTKDGAKRVGSFTLETLGELAKGYIKVQIKKQTGLDFDD